MLLELSTGRLPTVGTEKCKVNNWKLMNEKVKERENKQQITLDTVKEGARSRSVSLFSVNRGEQKDMERERRLVVDLR